MYVNQMTTIKQHLQESIQEVIGDDIELDWDTPLNEMGIQSMTVFLIKRTLEDKIEKEIDTEALYKYDTLNKFCTYCESL